MTDVFAQARAFRELLRERRPDLAEAVTIPQGNTAHASELSCWLSSPLATVDRRLELAFRDGDTIELRFHCGLGRGPLERLFAFKPSEETAALRAVGEVLVEIVDEHTVAVERRVLLGKVVEWARAGELRAAENPKVRRVVSWRGTHDSSGNP